MESVFEGDLKLENTMDGANVVIENELFCSDKTFSNAVLISLFGGNIDDSGKVENRNGWWGNYVDCGDNERKVISRFQYATNGTPLNVSSAKEAIEAAREDLNWLIESGACDDIILNGSIASPKRFDLSVRISANEKTVFNSVYSVNWEEMKNGL